MGVFNIYSKKERSGLSAANRKKLKNEVMKHLKTHKGVKKLVRDKTRATYQKMRSA